MKQRMRGLPDLKKSTHGSELQRYDQIDQMDTQDIIDRANEAASKICEPGKALNQGKDKERPQSTNKTFSLRAQKRREDAERRKE